MRSFVIICRYLFVARILGQPQPFRKILLLTLGLCIVLWAPQLGCQPSRQAEDRYSAHRSPIAVAVSPNRRLCLAANFSSGTVSLVDLASGSVVAEQHCGGGPNAATWIDETSAVVSLLHEDSLAVLRIVDDKITVERRIGIGDEPCGVVVTAGRIIVALQQEDCVAVFDRAQGRVAARIPVGNHPRGLALSPNEHWLITSCSTSGEVFVHDLKTYELISCRKLLDQSGNLGLPAILPDSSACIIPHIVNRTFPVNAENIEKGWVIDNRMSKLPLPQGEPWDQTQMALDTRGDAVGDAYAAVISRGGSWLAVTCGGSHEMLIFRMRDIPWPPSEPDDFIPDELLNDDGRFRRLELGGRPMGIAAIDDRTAVVANYLRDSLQIVDLSVPQVLRTIQLGGPHQLTAERRGEAIFYDADRSLNSWFSCHTCHLDGHTSGMTFDTLNDGSYGTPKLTPSLRGVSQTAPWTWHGWQRDLNAAMRKSLLTTMQTRHPPSRSDTNDLVAFLSGLSHPPNPHLENKEVVTNRIAEGRALFKGKAGCAACHRGDYFTSPRSFEVRLGSGNDNPQRYNPPSLRGLYSRRRFLHDGRAQSLPEALDHHVPNLAGGESLSDSEIHAILEYLRSL